MRTVLGNIKFGISFKTTAVSCLVILLLLTASNRMINVGAEKLSKLSETIKLSEQ